MLVTMLGDLRHKNMVRRGGDIFILIH
jgi:hypothetical protein